MITKIIAVSIIAFNATCPTAGPDVQVSAATATSTSNVDLSAIMSAMLHATNGGGIQVGSGDNPPR